MSSKLYGKTPDRIPVREYMITNLNGMEMKVISYGCIITSLKVPGRDGYKDDIVLGFDSLEGYLASTHYVGGIAGRYANRIAHGNFTLGDNEYILAKNIFPHHLHGGHIGFDKVVWDAKEFLNDDGVGIDFVYESADGEEGYPGNVQVHTRYFLNHHNEVSFEYMAITDKETIINLTQHSYFKLNSKGNQILDHELMINGDHFLPVDVTSIPTGEVKHVQGTPFDFRKSKLIRQDIYAEDEQLKIAKGYDHNWILNKSGNELTHAATLHDPISGRNLEVHTTEPGIQLYTGNFLNNMVMGKYNTTYGPHSGLCLETQHFPDSPHHREFPSTVLKPGEKYLSTTIWKFSTRR